MGPLSIYQGSLLAQSCVLAKKAAAFFRNSFSNRKFAFSASTAFNRAESTGDKAFTGSGFASR